MFIVSESGEARSKALALRAALVRGGVKSSMAMGDAGLKNQFKKADKSGALVALVLGQAELEKGQVNLKVLRSLGQTEPKVLPQHAQAIHQLMQGETQQIAIAYDDVIDTVTNLLNSL